MTTGEMPAEHQSGAPATAPAPAPSRAGAGWLVVPPVALSIAAFALAFYVVHARYHDTGAWIAVITALLSSAVAWVCTARPPTSH